MAFRSFVDSHGRSWAVWTVQPEYAERRTQKPKALERERRRRAAYRVPLAPEWANGWLAFETRGEKRRLAPIPEGWEALRDAELEDLCAAAIPVGAPRRFIE